jgi:hypothetical protein
LEHQDSGDISRTILSFLCCRRLLQEQGKQGTQKEIAESLGLSVQWVSKYDSAHACSEIGLKWFLFAFHDLRKVLGFVSVLDFFEHLSS